MDKFFGISLRILGVLAFIPIALFIWLYFFVDKPQTIGVTYVSSLTELDPDDTALEDSTMFLELNLKKNKNNNGSELFEILFTTYQGIPSSEYTEKPEAQIGKYSKGIQFFNGMDYSLNASYSEKISGTWLPIIGSIDYERAVWYNYEFSNVYYYDISYMNDEATSIASVQPLHSNSKFLVGVGQGENFQPAMLSFKNYIRADYNYIDSYYGKDPSPSSGKITTLLNYKAISDGYLYEALYNSCNSLDQGTYYITLDLGEFFNVYLWNEETLQFDKLTADTQFTYVTCKINVDDNGIVTQNESLFGMVAENDGSVTFPADESENKYWQIVNNVTLTLEDFNCRFSDLNNGYYLTIKNNVVNTLSEYKNLRITININLIEGDKILGIDSYGLYGIEIYKIKIQSDSIRDFYFMTNSISNVGSPILETTENINVINVDNLEVSYEN